MDTLTEQEGRRNVLISSINGKEQRLKSLRSKISLLMTVSLKVVVHLHIYFQQSAVGRSTRMNLSIAEGNDKSRIFFSKFALLLKDIVEEVLVLPLIKKPYSGVFIGVMGASSHEINRRIA